MNRAYLKELRENMINQTVEDAKSQAQCILDRIVLDHSTLEVSAAAYVKEHNRSVKAFNEIKPKLMSFLKCLSNSSSTYDQLKKKQFELQELFRLHEGYSDSLLVHKVSSLFTECESVFISYEDPYYE